MSFFQSPALPPTKLGRHRQLSGLAGIHVSPLCLGGMNIGDQWDKAGLGAMNKESSFKLLDAFYEAGGNFIDTASNYQNETSEKFIGEWMEQRGVRDQMVIATKYTTLFKSMIRMEGQKDDIKQKTSFVGNNLKSMHISVEESLKKLRTSYIDILYVHWWDYTTSIEEVMNGLHNLVASGKVLYLGISDTPAWVVSRANSYARLTGKTPFVVYQGAWSVVQRDLEREIIPMVRAEGMALAPWNVLAGGKIRTDEEEERRRKTGEKGRTIMGPDWERNETERKVTKVLEGVAKDVGASSIQAVAIAYVMQKVPFVFPIIGGRKVEHLKANIEALDVTLTTEHIALIEGAAPFDPGFPHTLFGDGTEYSWGFKMAGHFDKWPQAQALRPAPNSK
ncbi:aryl-alcohol dehydrogenase [Trametes meyenii]|nr:aryl-alcohol dehydrogenase [Trametes meyenii]